MTIKLNQQVYVEETDYREKQFHFKLCLFVCFKVNLEKIDEFYSCNTAFRAAYFPEQQTGTYQTTGKRKERGFNQN